VVHLYYAGLCCVKGYLSRGQRPRRSSSKRRASKPKTWDSGGILSLGGSTLLGCVVLKVAGKQVLYMTMYKSFKLLLLQAF
jgi:hypothetical protein